MDVVHVIESGWIWVAAPLVTAAFLWEIVRLLRDQSERADVDAFVREQIAIFLAQRIGRGVEDVKDVLRGRGRPTIRNAIDTARPTIALRLERRGRKVAIQVIAAHDGGRQMRERIVRWREVPANFRLEFERRGVRVIERPWTVPWARLSTPVPLARVQPIAPPPPAPPPPANMALVLTPVPSDVAEA